MKTPKLTKKIVRDDLALSDAISAVLVRSKRRKNQTRDILRWQRPLRRAVTHDAWMLFLRLDEIMNDRTSHEQDVLVRWAFRQGRRYERRRT